MNKSVHFLQPKDYFLLVLTFFLILPNVSHSKTYSYYVDKNYKGEEEGTEKKPYRTLAKALENIHSGSESTANVFLKNGSYEEDVVLEKNIFLIGKTGKNATITGTIFMKDGDSLKNLTVSGSNSGISVDSNANVLIENCEIKNFNRIGINAFPGNGEVVVKNSSIRNGGGKGFYIQAGRKFSITGNNITGNKEEGIDIRDNTKGLIQKNVLSGNGESGVELITGDSEITIQDNSITKNKASAIAAQFYKQANDTGKISILNNVLDQNNKYALDCARPSGGAPPVSYWNDSLNLSGNVIAKNNHGPTNPFCDIIDALDEEDEEKDNAIEEENQTIEIAEEKTIEREENIWEEVESLNNLHLQTEDEITQQIISINNQGAVSHFLFGPDPNKIIYLKGEVKKIQATISRLNALLKQSQIEENKVVLRDLMYKMGGTGSNTNEFLSNCDNQFSLWGWLKKIFL